MIRQIALQVYRESWEPEDRDANFKEDVAQYSIIDPMPSLDMMSKNMGIPVGALARYILVKWATSGSEGVLEIGPNVVRQMADIVNRAETTSTHTARLTAYQTLTQIIAWLKAPLDDSSRSTGQMA